MLGLCAISVVVTGDEVVSSEPRILFKNEEHLNRKTFPDVQAVLQKPLNDKKFENLNMFLVILKNCLTEAGYKTNSGEFNESGGANEIPI